MLKPPDNYRGLIPEATLAKALEQYGITEYITYPYLNINQTVIPVNRISETSRKALVEDRDGSLYFLKEIPWYIQSEPHAVSIIQLQHELTKAAVKVPTVQLTTSGQLIARVDNSRMLYLQEYLLDGTMYEGKMEQARAAGAELGKFRVGVETFYRFHSSELPQRSTYASTKDMLVLLLRKFMDQRSAMSKENQEGIQYFIRVCKELVDQWANQHDEWSASGESIAHGDLNPMNYIFSHSGSVLGLIDFDNACKTDPLVDIAEGLLTFSGITYRSDSSRFEDMRDLAFSPFQQFLEGYAEYCPLMPSDIEVLPLLVGTACIRLASLGLIRGDWPISSVSQHAENILNVAETSREYLYELNRMF